MPTWTMDLAFFRPAELAPLGSALGGTDDGSKGVDADTLDGGHGFYTSQGLMVRVERRTVDAPTALDALDHLVNGDYETSFAVTPDVYLAKFGSFDAIGILYEDGDAVDFD